MSSQLPQRLQHSPSLPNIWIPPHSGPMPADFSIQKKHRIRSPSAPESIPQKSPRAPHLKYPSTDPVHHPSKTHARRRTDHDQPHALLTPPLTPSSSIKTTIPSLDEGTLPETDEIFDSSYSDASRILLIGNVNRLLSVVKIKSTILESIISNVPEDRSATFPIRDVDPFKGINEKFLSTDGILPIVFYDIRIAKAAKNILLNDNITILTDCVGHEIGQDGQPSWLSAKLVSVEELPNGLGASSFLDGIDGDFLLSVHKLHNEEAPNVSEQDKSFSGAAPDSRNVEVSSIKVAILQNVLKSFGSLRMFKLINAEQEGSPCVVYRVEYHDSRESEIAMKDLHNCTMYGMFFTVATVCSSAFPSPQSAATPFPNGETFNDLSIGPAGSHSQIRQPFYNSSFNCQAIVVEQITPAQTALPLVPLSGEASSPPYFYTSFSSNVHQHEQITRPKSALGIIHQAPFIEQPWDHDRSDVVSPCYMPEGACRYCPPRGAFNALPYNPSYSPYDLPVPNPTMYYAPSPQSPSHLMNVTSIPARGVRYEYLDPQMLHLSNAGQWFDPAIAAIAPRPTNVYPIVPLTSVPPFVLRDDSHAIKASPPGYVTPDSHFMSYGEASSVFAHISTPESLSSTSSSPSITHGMAAGQHERNQLNISKIEEGLDTRTTIMLKNIPNKMSDVELTSYIGNVCPRRIDFLYLRMDFKNCCNVGYAFINFISVPDLLRFAEARLGTKWNMFSSEKVLQMSYANFQGKEALVEKFKNSSVMDERESWRPRIFYSSGPNVGLPEPFPPPTHIRRKERSFFNRGTLFPPGTNSLDHSASHRHINDEDQQHQRRRTGRQAKDK